MRVLLTALLALAACSTTEPAPSLVGTSWIFAGNAAASPPTIEFGEGRASGHASCNRWFGQMQLAGEALRFDAIGTTRMMCAGPSMQAERRFIGVLEGARRAHVEAGVLVLTDEAGAELARFNRRP